MSHGGQGVSILTNPHESPRLFSVQATNINAWRRVLSEGKYADYVGAVLKECPEADAAEIAEAF